MPTSSDDGGTAIRFEDVVKRFRVGLRAHRSLGDEFRRVARFLSGREKLERMTHAALKGVSFAIEKGESVGVIGPNGSGKSTILKLIADISKPTSGRIRVDGRVAALIEVTAGFHPEMTGRENVYMSGTILGMSKAEIDRRLDRIVDFAGVEEFIDTPVKRYSSGMNARLGFAVAAHVEPEILLVDEVLSVGDFGFQQRCIGRMHDLRDSGITIVFVSHNLPSVLGLCRRGILVNAGNIAMDGPTGEVIAAYHRLLSGVRHILTPRGQIRSRIGDREAEGGAAIEAVEILRPDGREVGVLDSGEEVHVRVRIVVAAAVADPRLVLNVLTMDGVTAYHFRSEDGGPLASDFRAGSRIVVTASLRLHLVEGNYALSAGVIPGGSREFLAFEHGAASFYVRGRPGTGGVAELNGEVTGVSVEGGPET